MATPRASSPQEQQNARDQKRVWSGAGRGRSGLSPVRRINLPLAPRGKKPAPSGLVMPPATDYFFVDGSGLTVPAASQVDLATIGTRDDQSAYMSWDAGGFIVVSADGIYEIAVTVGMNTADAGPFTMALPGVLDIVRVGGGPATTWAGSVTRHYDAGSGFAPCQVRNYAGADATIDDFSMYCRALIVSA